MDMHIRNQNFLSHSYSNTQKRFQIEVAPGPELGLLTMDERTEGLVRTKDSGLVIPNWPVVSKIVLTK